MGASAAARAISKCSRICGAAKEKPRKRIDPGPTRSSRSLGPGTPFRSAGMTESAKRRSGTLGGWREPVPIDHKQRMITGAAPRSTVKWPSSSPDGVTCTLNVMCDPLTRPS